MSTWSRLRSGVACVCIGTAAMLPVVAVPGEAVAQARMSMNSGMGPGASVITSRDLRKWSTILGLSSDQMDAAKTLHEAYREAHGAETKAMMDVMREAQSDFMETQDTSAFKDVAGKSAAIGERITALDRQFMDDIKSLLDARQSELWPKVERHNRRVKSLPGGMLSGEAANLITVVEDLKISEPTPELKDAIEQYELDLDKAIVERDTRRKALEKQSQELMKDFDPTKMDIGKMRAIMQDTRKAGVPVRDVNLRHSRLLASAIPADLKPDFDTRIRRALYPRIYRESHPDKSFKAALAFDDLTAEQRDAVTRLADAYTRDLSALNDRWAAAVAEEERDGGGDPFMGFGRFVPGASGDETWPTDEPKKARRELDNSTIEKLKAALTPEQSDRLPKREVDNPWMPNFGGDDGEDADESPARPSRSDRRR